MLFYYLVFTFLYLYVTHVCVLFVAFYEMYFEQSSFQFLRMAILVTSGKSLVCDCMVMFNLG